MNGDERPLGQIWIPHFIHRNPRVASIIGQNIKAARVNNTLKEIVHVFLELFKAT